MIRLQYLYSPYTHICSFLFLRLLNLFRNHYLTITLFLLHSRSLFLYKISCFKILQYSMTIYFVLYYVVIDKNECNNLNCLHACRQTPLGPRCYCQVGYELQSDQKTCQGLFKYYFCYIYIYIYLYCLLNLGHCVFEVCQLVIWLCMFNIFRY